ncbi:zinc-dependent peptidase [Pseudomonas taeanensis MS-3]|uniref:Zinc-dependent peptidase n=1 Tax=Pseudomonas taeanensis MS-3 TaxID=1395571 RepID=A0A0A1YFZ5_9PSED|nr:M90 family metallopeptidase [Pseudomonas taeanensis]KFX67559.1 zinc-dependent peptidase [Pseudomonas taeanensis MS-3]
MWSLRAWRRRRILARHPISPATWAAVRQHLPLLDGLDETEDQRLRERAQLFLHHKHLTALPGVELDELARLTLAAQAELPLLHLAERDWYRGFHEIVLYPDDFLSPQRHRDASGVVHEWDAAHSGEAWQQGPVILAWPGVQASGDWDAYNLVIHELAHKLDMLGGDANGLPPLHRDMRVSDWASAMQSAYDRLNAQLDANPAADTAIDPYAAEDPAEFFAVTSEYFFSAPDLLAAAFPAVYAQLKLFYRQDPLARLQRLQTAHPDYRTRTNEGHCTTNG